MITYIGSENIISPLGNSAQENFKQVKNHVSGISLFKGIGINKEDIHLAKISSLEDYNKFDQLLSNCISSILLDSEDDIIESDDMLVIISTTKADIQENLDAPIHSSVEKIKNEFQLKNSPLVISNACISGVLAINTANNLIQNRFYKHVLVVGADTISDFVIYGFQSLYAISERPCQPFDKERRGITLGEGAGGVLLSSNRAIFKSECFEFIEGTSSNDANHISGPSRTGEGLYRTVNNTLRIANISATEIDYISAHGTGTSFNDEMESIAFSRLGINNVPINSLKGYFGHTLGAAGLIESAISLQSMRNNLLIKSLGYQSKGTSEEINVLTENLEKEINTILKTASGFGGCNASAIIRRIS